MAQPTTPLARLWNIVKEEKKSVTAIYFYAILAGLIQLSLPIGIQAIINFVLGGVMSASLMLLIGCVITGVLINGLLNVHQMKIIEKIQQKLFVRYTFRIANKLPELDLIKSGKTYLPEYMNRFFEIPVLQKGLSKILIEFPSASIQIVFGLMLLSFYHPIFILFGIFLLIVLFTIFYLTGAKGLRTSLEESNFKYSVGSWIEELARGIKIFKFSKKFFLHLKKADERTSYYLDKRSQHFGVLLVQYRILIAVKTTITAAILIVGSILLISQELNIGQFIAAEIVILIVIGAVEKLIGNLDSVYDVLTSAEKLGNISDKESETSGSLSLQADVKGLSLNCKQLNFYYEAKEPVLSNVSFSIKSGEVVCISGDEGSGKSTLLQLLSGVYGHFSGEINIDDIPIRNYDIDRLRSQIGLGLSSQHVFHGSLLENVLLGNPNVPMEELIYWSEKIGLLPFVQSLPKGWDTELHPLGNHFPGSILKKIIMLRVLIRKPRLILLEEPWRGCSLEAKKKMQETLFYHCSHATVVIASNDLEFAKKCHQHIHLEKINPNE